MNSDNKEDYENLYSNIILREKLEKQATGAITTDILAKLKIRIDTLPQKCQQILHQVAKIQSDLDIEKLDSITLSLRQSREQCEMLEDEYEILKLKQKNDALQAKIDRNDKFLQNLRQELACSKDSFAKRDPNPDSIQDYIRQLKQKLHSYEESCEKAKVKFSKLAVPDSVLPASLASLAATQATLRHDAETMRARADNVALTRKARQTFIRLRK